MAAFVSTFAGSSVRGRSAVNSRRSELTTRAVIMLPTEGKKKWNRVQEPLYPLKSQTDFDAVVDSSHVEDAVVVAVLNKGNAASDIVEGQLKHYAQEFANLSFYAIEKDTLGDEFAMERLPRLMVFAKGEAVEDNRYRSTQVRNMRETLKKYAA